MADSSTTTFSFVLPEVTASDGTWGGKLNTNWSDLDALLSGTGTISPALTQGAWKIGATTISVTGAELNALSGLTVNSTALNYLSGATSNIQSQLNAKAAIASPALTGIPTAPTAVSGNSTTQVATTAFVMNAVSEATGGVDLSAYMAKAANLTDVANVAAARQNLGGTATGIALFTAASAAAARTALNVGVTGDLLFQAASASGARSTLGAGGTGTNIFTANSGSEVLSFMGITATTTELNYCDGVSSNIQTQLNGKLSSGALTGYATENFVTTRGYITSSALNGYAQTSGSTFTGTVGISNSSPYVQFTETDQSNYGWRAGVATQSFVWTNSSDSYASNRLTLSTAGTLTASGNVAAYSDERLKTDIDVIDGALDRVCAIDGVTFTRLDTGERGTGVIAQDVRDVLPEAVMEDDMGYLSVAYGNMVGLLIEAIKELRAEIEELKNGAAE